MVLEDDTAEQIKKCLECRYPKCINCLDRRVRPRRRTPRPPAFDFSRADELYREGLSDAEISSALRVSRQKIGRWRRRRGLPPAARPVSRG